MAPWEVKLVFVVAIYSLFKRFPDSSALLIASRCFFVGGHVVLYWLAARTNHSVMKIATWTIDRKEKARSAIQKDLVRPLLLRAVVVAALHYKLNMLPPLLVSVAMGLFSHHEAKERLLKSD